MSNESIIKLQICLKRKDSTLSPQKYILFNQREQRKQLSECWHWSAVWFINDNLGWVKWPIFKNIKNDPTSKIEKKKYKLKKIVTI